MTRPIRSFAGRAAQKYTTICGDNFSHHWHKTSVESELYVLAQRDRDISRNTEKFESRNRVYIDTTVSLNRLLDPKDKQVLE